MFLLLNLKLRLFWVLTVSLFFFAESSSKTLFLKTYSAVLEILRLAAWNFFHVEHEHIKRFKLFNPIKQFQFPFELDLDLNYRSEDILLVQKVLSKNLREKDRFSDLLIPLASDNPHLQIEEFKTSHFRKTSPAETNKPREWDQPSKEAARIIVSQEQKQRHIWRRRK